jgi:hypothetical protein
MEIEQMTIGQFKELSALMGPKKRATPFKVGDSLFIRTVTLYYTGKVKEIVGGWVVLQDAAWIADTGRFHDFIKDGKCNEYEGFIHDVKIPMDSIIDVTEWQHSLFRGQK